MDFSFGIMTYNSERYILETLNSIKYQIVNFGNDRSIQLVVSDDGSTDKTMEYVNVWTQNNRDLFSEIEIMISDVNEGVVLNYEKTFSKIKSDLFHIIAGDDLYSSINIFSLFDTLGERECISSFPLCIDSQGKFIFVKDRMERLAFARRFHQNDPEWLLKKQTIFGCYIFTPATIFRKSLFTNEVSNQVKQYTMFEDDPKWCAFLRDGIPFKFEMYPFVIYRLNDKSVSNSCEGEVSSIFKADVALFLKQSLIRGDYNLLQRAYIENRIDELNNGKRSLYVKLYGLFNNHLTYICNMLFAIRRNEMRIYNDYLLSNELYYKGICAESTR